MKPQGRSKGHSLRKRAEKILSQKPQDFQKNPVEDIKRLIHELDVHQIELDMQNDELRRAQAEIESSRAKYVDLYDFALIGYFTFHQTGLILEANLAGAKLLGVERSLLLRQPFIHFVSPEFRNTFRLHLEKVLSTGTIETCELKIVRKNGTSFYVSLEGIASKDSETHLIQCRSAIIDITERKHTEEELQKAHHELEIRVQKRTKELVSANKALEVEIAERKGAEEALKENEERYRSLFENMLDGYAYCKMFYEVGIPQDFVYLDVNPAFERLTGLKDVTGKRVSEVIPGIRGANPELFEIYGRVAMTGKPERFETYLDSLHIWFSISVYSPEKEYFVAVFDNITERKRAEERLRKREESFRALAENSPDIIERFDEEIRHIYGNPLAAKLHGISAEALIGKTNQELGVLEHYCRFWRERIQKVFQTGEAIEEENEFPTTSGKRIYQSRLVPEKAKDGAVTSVLIVSRDVTDRKRVEEILQEYQKAIESSQDMIAIVDRNYHYLIVNKAFLKYRGVGREQIIGRSVSEVLGKDAFEELIKKNLDTCFEGEVVQYEMKCTYPELGERDLSVSYFPIETREGINRVASVIRDITELKRIEETLRESETRRRLNAQVLIAQENERKLIAREIHDSFGSQLATIKHKMETFLQQTDNNVDGRLVESLESIIPILQESILEARRIQMNLRPSILDDLGILPTIEWLCRTFEETYPKIKVEKEIMVEESDVPLSLKTMIYRTLQEAMNNIAKHSKADLAHLSLRKIAGKIELFVQDNGHGFDLREVVGSESSMQGFGLVSMRERTELSGGSFCIDSTEGGGTTIRASWPPGIGG